MYSPIDSFWLVNYQCLLPVPDIMSMQPSASQYPQMVFPNDQLLTVNCLLPLDLVTYYVNSYYSSSQMSTMTTILLKYLYRQCSSLIKVSLRVDSRLPLVMTGCYRWEIVSIAQYQLCHQYHSTDRNIVVLFQWYVHKYGNFLEHLYLWQLASAIMNFTTSSFSNWTPTRYSRLMQIYN